MSAARKRNLTSSGRGWCGGARSRCRCGTRVGLRAALVRIDPLGRIFLLIASSCSVAAVVVLVDDSSHSSSPAAAIAVVAVFVTHEEIGGRRVSTAHRY